jgi:uncharacterized protein (DUF1800 family)
MFTQQRTAANRFDLGARPRDAGDRLHPKGWLEGAGRSTKRSTPAVRARPSRRKCSRSFATEVAASRCAGSRERWPTEEGRDRRQRRRDRVARYRPGRDRAVRPVLARALPQVNDRHRRTIESDQPFIERLARSGRITIPADKALVALLVGLYEQEAIRPHVTGNFNDLLLSVERHPAMILYLDNQASMGPSSQAATLVRRNRGRELGLNENLAREILELHTLGVDGGYTQADVTEFAKVLTGWSIGGALGEGRPALARFGGDAQRTGSVRRRRQAGRVLLPIRDARARRQGRSARLKEAGRGRRACSRRSLAAPRPRSISRPSSRGTSSRTIRPTCSSRVSRTRISSTMASSPVYRELIRADESWRQPLAKYKTPNDFVISTFARSITSRKFATDHGVSERAGQRPFTPARRPVGPTRLRAGTAATRC